MTSYLHTGQFEEDYEENSVRLNVAVANNWNADPLDMLQNFYHPFMTFSTIVVRFKVDTHYDDVGPRHVRCRQ
jgi:hypothetical protein